MFQDVRLPFCTEAAKDAGIAGRDIRDRATAIVLVAGFEDDGVDSIDEQICHAARIRRHQWDTKGGRFQNDVGETVVERRDDDGITCRKEREEIETVAKWEIRRGDLLVVRGEPGKQFFFDVADQQ